MKHIFHTVFVFSLLFVLIGCSQPVSAPTTSPTATLSLPTATNTLPPTATPKPTATPLPAGISYINPARYQVNYTVTVSGGNFKFTDLRLYQPKPVAWDAQQDVVIDEVTPQPTSEAVDALGNGMYYWKLTGIPKAGEKAVFIIKFTFTAYETRTNIKPEDVLPYDTNSALYKQYTRPERFIESDDPLIKATAAEIAAGETNPLLRAQKFYDYIVENLRYKRVGKGLIGAKTTLENKQGECGDYSSLFIALSRASGIPARSVVGYWAISGIDQTHVWAEFYLEGIGWVPVDPTIGQQSAAKRAYYFGAMDNQRVILNKGFNLALSPAAPDNYITQSLQTPLFWFWGNGDSSKVTIERTNWLVSKQK